MTSYYDIENCYRFILGRKLNEHERDAIARNLLQLSDLSLEEHRKRFLSSAEFHNRYGELLFNNFIPKSIVVLFETNYNFRLYLDLRQYHISFGIMNGEYEKFDLDLIKAIVPDDGHFIDVGGNVGYYSLSVAARPAFKGKVLAFEPLPKLWDLFNRSIQENGFADRVSVRQQALADGPGEMRLNNAEETSNAGATRLVVDTIDQKIGRSVEVETLDRVIGAMRPDAMKVDIQGAEGLFLRGAQHTIATHKPTMLMEINRDMLGILSKTPPGAIHQHLTELGYSIWSSSREQLTQVEAASQFDLDFSAGKVANILAIHADRFGQIHERIQAFGVEMVGKTDVPAKAMKSEKPMKLARSKVKRGRVREAAL
ncbi:FkbM family methyltransferase [Rhizobium sp. AP16]|uniref:FkbM family methyltransferase n=1 Tax=Rhizobium sp. AP16 TaxID=1144306 RepID=UPI00026ED081|nr:FkbM family methyltransferase [Rhizobium sp. AP16]EJK81340.1 methyltransferase, FkbM family [Rhizobium sp. AP16]